jgi:acyl-CoA reductase-like NAD-dependent aldehyde dehydrogenase
MHCFSSSKMSGSWYIWAGVIPRRNPAHRVAAALNAGTIWVNGFFIRDLRALFGGAGDSGIGREAGGLAPRFSRRRLSSWPFDAANGQ